jgi:hypothetical protein
VERFVSLFRGRQDAFGLLQGGKIMAVRRPLTLIQYRLHLAGKLRLGVYPLLPDGHTCFLALDFDGPGADCSARRVFERALHHGLSLAWEISKSRGVHLWLFFAEPVPARDARSLGRVLLDEAKASAEIFPKQDRLPAGGLGNFIWLPFSGESVRMSKTVFVDPMTGTPHADQWAYLHSIQGVPRGQIINMAKRIIALDERPVQGSEPKPRVYVGVLLPCARAMLQGVAEGCRDVAAFRLAVHLKAGGASRARAEQALQRWDAARNRPPLGPAVIGMKVRSAYDRSYTSYGCEDPLVARFCDERCPVRRRALAVPRVSLGGVDGSSTSR